jgi:hypothetical protein
MANFKSIPSHTLIIMCKSFDYSATETSLPRSAKQRYNTNFKEFYDFK